MKPYLSLIAISLIISCQVECKHQLSETSDPTKPWIDHHQTDVKHKFLETENRHFAKHHISDDNKYKPWNKDFGEVEGKRKTESNDVAPEDNNIPTEPVKHYPSSQHKYTKRVEHKQKPHESIYQETRIKDFKLRSWDSPNRFSNKHQLTDKRSEEWRGTTDATVRPMRHIPDPPNHKDLIPMARYVVHNADWASIATISSLPSIENFPFSNVKSLVDGSIANSTGIPYFYMSPLDFTARDLAKNTRSTVMVSLEETRYCEEKNWDAEDPRCTRVMLSGKMKKVKENSTEYLFAKSALFERHPSMANFPPDHDFFVAKLKIIQIAMVDWFGGAKFLPVRDYLHFNYTSTDKIDVTKENQVDANRK